MALFPTLENPDHAFGEIARLLLPTGLIGLLIASMLAAAFCPLSANPQTSTGLGRPSQDFLESRDQAKILQIHGWVPSDEIPSDGFNFKLLLRIMLSMFVYFLIDD